MVGELGVGHLSVRFLSDVSTVVRFLPGFRMLLLFLVLEQLFDFMSEGQELLLGDLAAVESLTGLKPRTRLSMYVRAFKAP